MPMRTIVSITLGLLLWVGPPTRLLAQEGTELAPRGLAGQTEGELPFGKREVMAQEGVDHSEVLIARLESIRLTGREEAEEKRHVGADGGWVVTQGLTVDEEDVAEAILPFVGHRLTARGLDRLIETLLRHYEANDRPVTDIFAPDQALDRGAIELVVIDGVVGTIGLESGGVFNDELLAGAVRLRGGDVLRTSELQRHLDWFNRNPFRPATLYAAPGAGEGEANMVFAFGERRPWRVYVGYENTGAEAAGDSRYLAGINWGNAFDLDHSLNYQFTTSDSLKELSAHALSWDIPIHSRHHFARLSAGWAEISTQSRSSGILVDTSGTSWQLGGAYGMQLTRWNDFKQEVSVGVEYKSSDNFLVFGGTNAHPGAVVEVLQFRADYQASRQFGREGGLQLSASLIASPGGLSGLNSDQDFERFRPGAEASYLYGRAKAVWVRRLPDSWTLRASGQLQLSSGALLPTEQLGLGGHATVRGFEEREFLADHGYVLSTELRAPSLRIPLGEGHPVQVQFLGFLDHAGGWRRGTGPGQDGHRSFTSMGAGLRAQFGRYLNLRADVGVPLDRGDAVRGHVGVTSSF